MAFGVSLSYVRLYPPILQLFLFPRYRQRGSSVAEPDEKKKKTKKKGDGDVETM